MATTRETGKGRAGSRRDAAAEDDAREQKDETPTGGDGTGTGGDGTGGADGGGGGPAATSVSRRREQYLVGHKPVDLLPADVQPMDLGALEQHFKDDEEVEYKRTLAPRGVLGALSATTPGAQNVIVAAMAPGRAEALKQHPQLIVERDEELDLGQTVLPAELSLQDPGTLAPLSDEFDPTIRVLGEGDRPLAGASVYVFGRLWPYQGATDDQGRLTLPLFGERPDSLKALYVKPKADHWSLYVQQPLLRDDTENVITVPPLGSTLAGFPDQQSLGWGQKALRVDELPPTHRGKGVKVAVIDSGAGGDHRDLQDVSRGFDVTAHSADGWKDDTIGHGSHCAGVILARDNGRGIVGIAPEADLLVYKIFPGGRFSDLLDALDLAISEHVDVANLSLGTAERSQLVEDKLALAKTLGVACIVAAGNDAGPVRFPANSPHVLAVAAVGRHGAFPPDSYHARQVAPGTREDPEGYFSAKFTCFGPEIDVCAPGVGIVSSVPPDNYGAWDGTSMAAPHVTGLAALLLAHHPDFQGRWKASSAERVEHLFDLIRGSARPLDLGDPHRVGHGLPDAVRAFDPSAAPAVATPASASGAAAGDGTGASTSTSEGGTGAAAALKTLRTLLESAGLLERPDGVTAPLSSEPPPPRVVQMAPVRTLEQLAGAVRGAGLANGAKGANGANGAVAPQSTDGADLEPLRRALAEAGLA